MPDGDEALSCSARPLNETNLLSWAEKAAAGHGASATRRVHASGRRIDVTGAAQKLLDREYWPNQSNGPCQGWTRGSELGDQRLWRSSHLTRRSWTPWSLRRRTILFSFHGFCSQSLCGLLWRSPTEHTSSACSLSLFTYQKLTCCSVESPDAFTSTASSNG